MKPIDINTLLSTFEMESRGAWAKRIQDAISPEQQLLDSSLGISITGDRPDHPAYAKFNHQWKIGQSFQFNKPVDPNKLNQEILASLNGGVEHLMISLSDNLDQETAEVLLDSVIPTYITTTFLLRDSNVSIELPQKWKADNYEVLNLTTGTHWMTYDANLSVVDNTVAALSSILQSIDQPTQTYYIYVPINDNYLSEIAKLRALHHTFNLINQEYNWQHRLHIIATYGSDNHKDLDYQKIGNTARATAAILGGGHTILPFGLEPNDAEEVRLGINQLHLLRLESYLDKVADPLAGSHLIEQCTDTIARAVWTKLNESQ
jgi:hypothetical protein